MEHTLVTANEAIRAPNAWHLNHPRSSGRSFAASLPLPTPKPPPLRIIPRNAMPSATTRIVYTDAGAMGSQRIADTQPLPLGPVIGGVVAGVTVALAAVFAWIAWLKRKRRIELEKKKAAATLGSQHRTATWHHRRPTTTSPQIGKPVIEPKSITIVTKTAPVITVTPPSRPVSEQEKPPKEAPRVEERREEQAPVPPKPKRSSHRYAPHRPSPLAQTPLFNSPEPSPVSEVSPKPKPPSDAVSISSAIERLHSAVAADVPLPAPTHSPQPRSRLSMESTMTRVSAHSGRVGYAIGGDGDGGEDHIEVLDGYYQQSRVPNTGYYNPYPRRF